MSELIVNSEKIIQQIINDNTSYINIYTVLGKPVLTAIQSAFDANLNEISGTDLSFNVNLI